MAGLGIHTQENFVLKIYAYTTTNMPDNVGYVKIGCTTQNVQRRIKNQTSTVNAKFIFHWAENAPYDNKKNCYIRDTDFHAYLKNQCNVERHQTGREWFKIAPEQAKKYFNEFCKGKYKKFIENAPKDYVLREEQQQAVDTTKKYFEEGTKPREFLWNAKPRFGKTLTAYDFIFQIKAQKVLIVTNRPSIANSWFDDYKIFVKGRKENYQFVSSTDSLSGKNNIEYANADKTLPIIAFLSLQYLKVTSANLDWVYDNDWDLLIVDEAHEGVETDLTDRALKDIRRKFTLYLSGTPFKALANNEFREDQIFNWSYEDEQAAKKNWENPSEDNPYADLPQMTLYTYRLSKMIVDEINSGADLSDKNVSYAFDLNEFFSTDDKNKFIHEPEVLKFLDTLTCNEKFPFSTPELRAELNHTFWLFQRVKSAEAMAKLLSEHKIFKDYKVIVAAGKENTEKIDDAVIKKNFDKVKRTIANSEKTITLSVGQLTVGVTIPEWKAILILSDIKSAAAYMQAAFRVQNPCTSQIDGKTYRKTNCYVFDFSPARALKIYDEYANNTKKNGNREDNIRRLINFFPVLANVDGKMIKLDAEEILSLPQKILAQERDKMAKGIVDNGFMDNNLFVNIGNIFSAQNSVEKIVRQINSTETGENLKSPSGNKSSSGKSHNGKTFSQFIISKTDAIFGKKIYVSKKISDVDEIISIAQEKNSVGFEKIREQYPYDGVNSAIGKSDERLAKKLKDEQNLTTDKISEILQNERYQIVSDCEKIKREAEQKDVLEYVRSKLRDFTRTVPSFLMAYGDRNFTLSNLETYIDDETFLEVTGITIADFKFLRDGGVRDGENFAGHLFDEEIFNAAVQEFLNRKDELADYFDESHDKDIFDYIPPQKTSQIFTPRFIVREMVDALAAEVPNVFSDPNQIFIDPYMKSGIYITEIVKRLFKNLRASFASDADCLRHILENQVYGFAPNEIIYRIATEYIFGRQKDISRRNFFRRDLTDIVQSGDVANFVKKNFVIRVIILDRERVKKFGEVFTPTDIVKKMLDDENIADVWEDIDAKILEPTAGEGAFLAPILLRKLALAQNPKDMFHALASIYAIEIQPDNLEIVKKNLREIFIAWHEKNFGTFDEDNFGKFVDEIIGANIIHGDALTKKTAAGTDIEFIDWNLEDFKPARAFSYKNLNHEGVFAYIKSEFAVIIGNPPYQLDTKGDNKTYAAPIYHKFLESFWRACNRVMMIHPARCLFQAGGTPRDFMRNLLSDEHIKVIFYEADSSQIFKNTDIKGGVAVTYRDANENFGAIGVYIPFPELQSIFQKVVVDNPDFQPFSKIVYPRADRKLSDKFFADYPDSPLKNNDAIGTNAFTKFPEIFSAEKPDDGHEYIQILGRIGVKRVYKWIRRDYVKSLDNLDKYKVFIPSSNGSGAIGEVVSTPLVGLPLVGLPLVGSTETFTGVGAFDSEVEAEFCLKYIKTKFARALLGILKVTQHNPAETWRYVPMQDFSTESAVPWERSVAEIDKYLYKKYNLSQGEINFIETKIKAM